jgi:hypothetical protein
MSEKLHLSAPETAADLLPRTGQRLVSVMLRPNIERHCEPVTQFQPLSGRIKKTDSNSQFPGFDQRVMICSQPLPYRDIC